MHTLDQKFLDRTVGLAKRGRGVFPNPRVGCVAVKKGRVIAEGWHKKFGGPHAEAVAFNGLPVGGVARGATVYVSMEPCADWKGKKTPSCAKRLVREGVKRVVIGMPDPNPKVQGKGIAMLKRAGITVDIAPPRAAVYDMNHEYLMQLVRLSSAKPNFGGRPFVLMKTAMSVDGKIGTPDHRSIALSTPEDRRAVDRLRARVDAIMVGGVTLRNDTPRLTVKDPRLVRQRIAEGRDPQPLRVAVTGNILVVGRDRYTLGTKRANLQKAMTILAVRYGVKTLMLEGGGELNFSMLAAGLVDAVRVATAPIILGGRTAPTLVDGEGFDAGRPVRLKLLRRERLGEMEVVWYRIL